MNGLHYMGIAGNGGTQQHGKPIDEEDAGWAYILIMFLTGKFDA